MLAGHGFLAWPALFCICKVVENFIIIHQAIMHKISIVYDPGLLLRNISFLLCKYIFIQRTCSLESDYAQNESII